MCLLSLLNRIIVGYFFAWKWEYIFVWRLYLVRRELEFVQYAGYFFRNYSLFEDRWQRWRYTRCGARMTCEVHGNSVHNAECWDGCCVFPLFVFAQLWATTWSASGIAVDTGFLDRDPSILEISYVVSYLCLAWTFAISLPSSKIVHENFASESFLRKRFVESFQWYHKVFILALSISRVQVYLNKSHVFECSLAVAMDHRVTEAEPELFSASNVTSPISHPTSLPSKNQSLSGLQDIFTGIPSHKR